MIAPSLSIILLSLITLLIYLGLGQRILDRMRLRSSTALIILVLMIFGHFIPAVSLGPRLSLNLGALIPLGVVVYLLLTTSPWERRRALTVSFLTALLILATDKLLPVDPGLLDPVFSGGIFAGLLAYSWGRSRRSAFIAGILGVFLADLTAWGQILLADIPQTFTLGSGGFLSSMVLSPFLAVLIGEIIGETREKWQRNTKIRAGDQDDD